MNFPRGDELFKRKPPCIFLIFGSIASKEVYLVTAVAVGSPMGRDAYG